MLDQARPAIRSIEEICDPEYYQGRAKYPRTWFEGRKREDVELMENRFKQLRAHLVLTQEQFAKRIGRTKGYISNVENGHTGMSSSTVSSICSAFAVREEWLRDGTGEMFEREAHKVIM
jgi:DNA-binding XRE family transcriptional regulator